MDRPGRPEPGSIRAAANATGDDRLHGRPVYARSHRPDHDLSRGPDEPASSPQSARYWLDVSLCAYALRWLSAAEPMHGAVAAHQGTAGQYQRLCGAVRPGPGQGPNACVSGGPSATSAGRAHAGQDGALAPRPAGTLPG